MRFLKNSLIAVCVAGVLAGCNQGTPPTPEAKEEYLRRTAGTVDTSGETPVWGKTNIKESVITPPAEDKPPVYDEDPRKAMLDDVFTKVKDFTNHPAAKTVATASTAAAMGDVKTIMDNEIVEWDPESQKQQAAKSERKSYSPSVKPDGWEEVSAKSVRVIDGDTVEILIEGQPSERVRLLGIDAPESSQEYGQQSKATLQQCVSRGDVKVYYKNKDRYDRLLGKIMAAGADCNLYQVASGSAWHYKKYAKNQPHYDQKGYSVAEKQAKNYRNGLWQNPAPQAPWDYRKNQ